jgi:hypothetical protein
MHHEFEIIQCSGILSKLALLLHVSMPSMPINVFIKIKFNMPFLIKSLSFPADAIVSWSEADLYLLWPEADLYLRSHQNKLKGVCIVTMYCM